MALAAKPKKSAELRTVYDQDGNQIDFDVREDEEQSVKLTQTVELLLAAGYFRARIKGLSPFDKVVGGMTWCITTCNFDVDVDLLFQENSTIGQKIALTEKIVSVLPRMKCPHRIEPHQIQGLDFIHIYPVVQWLVQRAIETKEEMGDYIRAYSISQFDKQHSMPQDIEFQQRKTGAIDAIQEVKEAYKPRRRFKHTVDRNSAEEEVRVQSTLLEFGRRYGISKKTNESEEKDGRKAAAARSLGGAASEEQEEERLRQEEEQRIQALMGGLQEAGHQGKLTASAVGSLVGMQSQHITQVASEYADKQAALAEAADSGRPSGAAHHQRVTAVLRKQITVATTTLDNVRQEHGKLEAAYSATQQALKELTTYSDRIDSETQKLDDQETEENREVLDKLRSLVAMNENLKRQEQEFKAHCKEEMARLQDDIRTLKEEGVGAAEDEDSTVERSALIEKQHAADRDKLHKIRLLLARKNREIGALQRKIDEVPSRAELSQYQRRFVELYNQIANKHKETKQFYTLYNTLDDTKLYLGKEVNLLNSIHDNFEQAMSNPANKEQFLQQFESIVAGVNANKGKVEKKKLEEKMRRDQLNDQYLDLVEKQRLYFKTVKDFTEECRKNEILLAKLGGRG